MSKEQSFVLVIVVISVAAVLLILLGKHGKRIARVLRGWLVELRQALLRPFRKSIREEAPEIASDAAAEEQTEAEWLRLQKVVEERKREARNSDISYHLWDFYLKYFRPSAHESPVRHWLEDTDDSVRIIRSGSPNGINETEFLLKQERYRFSDEEERQPWFNNSKSFSFYLHDATGRCLIEVPMRARVYRDSRQYSIVSGGPEAFIPGDWIQEFINLRLRREHLRKRQIRQQKHEQRASEIEDLKKRFGVSD